MAIIYKLVLRPYYKKILGQFGQKSFLPFSTKLEFAKNIFIGNQVSIGRMSWLASNPLTNNRNPILTIGDGTYIGNFAHIYCTSKIEIGKNVLFADKVYVSDNLHTFEDVNVCIINQSIKQLDTINIGDGAWIGENVCIIGASIGKQSVVGANSVVNKSIPDYCVAVGSPAKIIKRYSFEKKAWLKTNSGGDFV
ncbi:MAG: acyltransferase [Paludibacter sp.]